MHDSLLYFLDHLPEDRLLEKLVDIAYLPAGSSRSADLMAFVAKTPSLQKLGQILARNQALSPEYQEALQQLENGIHTMTRDELVQFIADDMGKNNIASNQVEFADTILAEGSVGAVIRATWTPPGSHRDTRRHLQSDQTLRPHQICRRSSRSSMDWHVILPTRMISISWEPCRWLRCSRKSRRL